MADEEVVTTDAPAGDPPVEGGDADAADAPGAEDKGADAKGTEDKGNGEDKGEPIIAYEPFNLPEGMEIDQAALKEFAPIAQKHGLKQEGAQELVDLFASRIKAQADAHAQAWSDAMGKWRDEAKADKEIGGERFTETEAHVALAMKKLGTPELENILKITGTGNHVEIVRLLSKVGKIIDNDSIDLGGVLGEAPKTQAEILFPNQGKQ